MAAPLEGLKVVELARILAGPWIGQTLADLGAEVIKVEAPEGDVMRATGIDVYQIDHEDANGQYEVNFNYADALTTADRVTFFRMLSTEIAKKYGAIVTHMPKPFSDRTGSGLHVHFHLASTESGKNVFLDTADPRGLATQVNTEPATVLPLRPRARRALIRWKRTRSSSGTSIW